MVTRVLGNTGSVSEPLSYNEIKVLRGEAKIIAVHNIEGDSLFSIRRTLLLLENHPAIHANTQTKGIHLSINPSPADSMDDQAVEGYVVDLMQLHGYGKQPYVLFRHDDIERTHYHLVSVRVDSEGKIIHDIYYRSLMRIQNDLSKKYGFSVEYETDIELAPSPLKKGMLNIIGQIGVNVRTAMTFLHSGEPQLRIILKAYNVILKRGNTEHNGQSYQFVSFRGIDDDGNFLIRPVLDKKVLGRPFDDIYHELHNDEPFQPVPGTIVRVMQTLQDSNSYNSFKNKLLDKDIRLFFVDNNGLETTDINEIKDVFFVDQRARQCLTLAQCHLQLRRVLSLLDEDADEKKKREKKEEPQNNIKKNNQMRFKLADA